jgi:cholinesterase
VSWQLFEHARVGPLYSDRGIDTIMRSTLYLLFAVSHVACPTAQNLPQVDLGYQIHRASSFNESAEVYNFSNIRYAQPPVGNLRWALPVPPFGRDSIVRDGSVGRICPQGTPDWFLISALFSPYILTGNTSAFNYTQAQEALQAFLATGASLQAPDSRITEDCLFLDVFTPKAVFDSATRNSTARVPVLVW